MALEVMRGLFGDRYRVLGQGWMGRCGVMWRKGGIALMVS
jgi:hypothetical protein